jgi:uncharacterized membrane protein YphA (DoxX/SURF4 family)
MSTATGKHQRLVEFPIFALSNLFQSACPMSLTVLFFFIATIAIVLTLIANVLLRGNRQWLLHFFQYFSGALFVVSGYVKAVDPLGTAYKMEQYFAEFEATFQGTWLSFLSGLFPWLSQGSVWFAIIMVVLELVIGVLLLLGVWRRFAAWAFFIIILFFTALTGFTYLTGYVPSDANFFAFGDWTTFNQTNMRVTDCGCFGDFIKLEPRTSFLKDVFLLIPAIWFLLAWGSFHQFFSQSLRRLLAIGFTLLSLLFCLYNVYMNEPVIDFRPFTPGVNIRAEKEAQDEALANVPVTMVIENKADGRIVKLAQDEYMKVFRDYPKEEWTFLDPEVGEPDIPITKVREFEVSTLDGDEGTYALLDFEGYHFWIISQDLLDDGYDELVRLTQDTLWTTDTLVVDGDTLMVQRVEQIDQRTEVEHDYKWRKRYLGAFNDVIMPLVNEAAAAGIPSRLVLKYANQDKVLDLVDEIGFEGDVYLADDILLKTIMRSNPGLLLMKDGEIIQKWHFRKVPGFQDIKARYIPNEE